MNEPRTSVRSEHERRRHFVVLTMTSPDGDTFEQELAPFQAQKLAEELLQAREEALLAAEKEAAHA